MKSATFSTLNRACMDLSGDAGPAARISSNPKALPLYGQQLPVRVRRSESSAGAGVMISLVTLKPYLLRQETVESRAGEKIRIQSLDFHLSTAQLSQKATELIPTLKTARRIQEYPILAVRTHRDSILVI